MAYKKQPKSTFQKIVFVFVIVMIALTLLTVVASML
ncbi:MULTISPECIES: DUF4044 domain-containing protein [unclassified Lactococcus]|nr:MULTISPECIES: DUF4044 domain-containing protein [unclassified Lactococcus]MQW23743.1 DUF4044 domain-containing protein [Lactococcus sp. dk101]TXK37462.1 DUF4044 domain-containing protein [Lactococcus sp. dk310]TXK48805.1 DUF4044 domain-containing protein [Lactococcus sp. dk322]